MADFVFPPSPTTGQQVTGPFGEIYTFDGTKWTLTEGSAEGGGATVVISETPPPSPTAGTLWWATDVAKMYLWDGSQWVIVVNTPDGGPIVGVTDGSDAAPGMVGEVIAQSGANVTVPLDLNVIAQINIPPGDWEISAGANIGTPGGTVVGLLVFGINTVDTGMGPPPQTDGMSTAGSGADLPFGLYTYVWMRLSVAVTTTVYILTNNVPVSTTGTPTITISLWSFMARRMR